VSGRRSGRPAFDVWRTQVGEDDCRKLRADLRQVVATKEDALARDGCAAADYRLSGESADRFCSLHLMRDWRMIVGFPAPRQVAVVLVGRHIRGSRRDVYGRFYKGLGIAVPGVERKKPPCCGETGVAPVDADAVRRIAAGTKALVQGR
jgi:hypothetical protein